MCQMDQMRRLNRGRFALTTVAACALALAGLAPLAAKAPPAPIAASPYGEEIDVRVVNVEVVVTDSPLLLFMVYASDEYPPSWKQLVLDIWNSYQNVNFHLERVKKYAKVGRSQTEDEARALDQRVMKMLDKHGVTYTSLPGDKDAPRKILESLG